MKPKKQTNFRNLLTEQHRFDDRRLAAGFVEMAGALPCRPQPRHLWDNAASPGRTSYRGLVLVHAAQAAMRAALSTGDRTVVEETARRIDHHFEEAKSVALVDYRRVASGEVTFADAVADAAKDTARLSVALTQVALYHTDAARDEAMRDIDAEILRLVNLRVQLATERAVMVNPPRQRRVFA